MDGWTMEDAAAILDPPMTETEIKALIIAARLKPIGTRPRQPGTPGGRPKRVYDPDDLLRAHAAIARFLCETRG